ncbi:MAG: hypothetical protein ACT4N5_05150 [Nitrosopumilaceae archaeon]
MRSGFLVLSVIILSFSLNAAFAQYGGPAIPQMEEVSGEYSNDDVGVTITFPDGWSGIAMETPQGTMATASPGGMESQGEVSQAMTLMMSEKTKVDSPPTDPSQGQSLCDTLSTRSVTVSGAAGTETVVSCTDDDGNVTKSKIISAQTETHWISVMFISPESEYDGAVGKFDDSVKTLNISNAIGIESPPETPMPTEPIKLEARTIPVSVSGENVDVMVQSSSSVTKFGLDEANKEISFTADGDEYGKTRLGLGSVLKGPFVVMVDGQETKEFTTDDLGETLELEYSAGTHEFSVIGTQVIPEFPVAVIGVIAVVIGMVAILGRTKIFGTIRY